MDSQTKTIMTEEINLLQEICNFERRSKIDQLKVLIEREHRILVQDPRQTV